MPAKRLKEFLDAHHIMYTAISHSPAYTAQEVAASVHIPGKEMAKTVIVKIDGRLAMAVLPANQKLNTGQLKSALSAVKVEVTGEQEFRDRFADCEIGAMPPFGNLYGLDVLVERNLAKDEQIAFNACTHTEVIRMKYTDFLGLVKPKELEFSS
jgi:Ala-tRNA(Pro) deacylase